MSLAATLLTPGVLELIPDAMVAVDKSGRIVQANSQAEKLFGYSPSELLGMAIEVLVPDRYRLGHSRHREEFTTHPKTRPMGSGLDLYAKRRDGSEFPVTISLSPVSTGSGMLVLSAIRDTSAQKKIENELRAAHEELGRRADRDLWESRSRLALIVDSSEDAIIGKTLDGAITNWNKAAERIYGYTAEEMVGQSISKLVPKNRLNEVPEILARIRRGESVEHYESTRLAKDGRSLDVSISVSPIRDSEGQVIGASVIARDITAQKKAEEQLRQAQKMEAVGRLAGGVAHDYNNILGIVTACTELLRDRVEHDSGSMQFVESIRKATDRGAALTRQLLTFSRKQAIKPVVLDLNERLKETSKLLRPLMGDDVEIVMTSRSPSVLVEVDPGQLDQIVLNLGVNARDAMPKGGKLIIETSSAEFDQAFAQQHPPMTPGKYVLLAVSDTGAGMDEATISRLFEPFFTTKELGKGTGLGLATVHGIVKQTGGHIWVYSELGRGTTFKIYLPSAEHKVGLAPQPAAELTARRRPGTTILLVEDDELMRALTRKMMEEHGYAVIEACDGKAALECAAANLGKIDLVLTDVVMRGMSGPELVLRLTDVDPNLKFIYMSGYAAELISNSGAEGAFTLLEKPFTRSSLLKTLDHVLA